MTYNINLTETDTEIKGYLNNWLIISLYQSEGEWKVGTSACLNTDLHQAKLSVDVMVECFKKLKEKLGKKNPNSLDFIFLNSSDNL